MSKNIKNNSQHKGGDEFFTLYETAHKELMKYDKYLKDKKIICPCDTRKSNIYKYLKNMGYTVNCDSKEWRNVDYSKYDIVITNPPFSQFKEFILKLNELNIDYIMIAPGVPVYKAKVGLNLSESDFYSTVKNFYIGNYVSEFYTPDGTIKRAWGQWISSIQNDDKTNIEVNIEGGNDAKS